MLFYHQFFDVIVTLFEINTFKWDWDWCWKKKASWYNYLDISLPDWIPVFISCFHSFHNNTGHVFVLSFIVWHRLNDCFLSVVCLLDDHFVHLCTMQIQRSRQVLDHWNWAWHRRRRRRRVVMIGSNKLCFGLLDNTGNKSNSIIR